MPGEKPVIYWDACTFISYIQRTQRTTNELVGLDYYANQFDLEKIILITSTLTRTEILDYKLGSQENIDKFNHFFSRSDLEKIAPIDKITLRAAQLRGYHEKRGFKLKTPDAIHLATALLYKVDEFHTFDGSGKSTKPGLIDLSGDVGGEPLIIKIPEVPKLPLGF